MSEEPRITGYLELKGTVLLFANLDDLPRGKNKDTEEGEDEP